MTNEIVFVREFMSRYICSLHHYSSKVKTWFNMMIYNILFLKRPIATIAYNVGKCYYIFRISLWGITSFHNNNMLKSKKHMEKSVRFKFIGWSSGSWPDYFFFYSLNCSYNQKKNCWVRMASSSERDIG